MRGEPPLRSESSFGGGPSSSFGGLSVGGPGGRGLSLLTDLIDFGFDLLNHWLRANVEAEVAEQARRQAEAEAAANWERAHEVEREDAQAHQHEEDVAEDAVVEEDEISQLRREMGRLHARIEDQQDQIRESRGGADESQCLIDATGPTELRLSALLTLTQCPPCIALPFSIVHC